MEGRHGHFVDALIINSGNNQHETGLDAALSWRSTYSRSLRGTGQQRGGRRVVLRTEIRPICSVSVG